MNPRPTRPALRAMRQAFERLPQLDRTIFMRVRFDDDSYARIARDLGISPRQVERSVAQTLLALDAAAARPKQRVSSVRIARIWAWLRAHLPQG